MLSGILLIKNDCHQIREHAAGRKLNAEDRTTEDKTKPGALW